MKEKIIGFLKSKLFYGMVIGVGSMLVLGAVFQAGVMAGFHKASFGREWGENYEKNFGGSHDGMMGMSNDGGSMGMFPNAHGIIGKITTVAASTITIVGSDQTEYTVVLDKETAIRRMHEDGTLSDLVPSTMVMVLGNPSVNGQITAKFIRILPNLPQPTTPVTPTTPTTPITK